MFSFRLWAIFYVFALFASAMATFGAGGLFIGIIVLLFWLYCSKNGQPQVAFSRFIIVVIAVAALGALLIGSVPNVRQAARRVECLNNMRQLATAIINYHDTKKSFPPPYIADANGKPKHSWRVLILPYLGETTLYQKYNFNEPWNGPNNRKLAARMPAVFRCPNHRGKAASSAGITNYFAIVGPDTMWPEGGGRSYGQIFGGTMNAPLLVEASGYGVNWMEPRDLTAQEAIELFTTKTDSGHTHTDEGWLTTTIHENAYRNVALLDGHIEFRPQFVDPSIAKAFVSVQDSTPRVDYRWDDYVREDISHTYVKWGKVWGLIVFLVLALIPARWLPKKGVAEASSAPKSGCVASRLLHT
jgi:hypothetical protein